MKNTLNEFKEFIAQGNILDMAIGVIIGGAFGKIVTSLVEDIIMPLIGIVLGNVDFTNLAYRVGEGEGAVVRYGNFIQNIINFLIIAFCIFFFVKKLMSFTTRFRKTEEVLPTTKVCPFCKTEIDIEATRCPHCTSQL